MERTFELITPEHLSINLIIAMYEVSKETPLRVPVKPAYSERLYCYLNVFVHCENLRGKIVQGWDVSTFEDDHALFIPHAIWKSPKGKYIDVSPDETATIQTKGDEVLFLPDSTNSLFGIEKIFDENEKRMAKGFSYGPTAKALDKDSKIAQAFLRKYLNNSFIRNDWSYPLPKFTK